MSFLGEETKIVERVDSKLAELDTPVVLVEHSIVQRNLEAAAARAQDAGVALRPHVKTHRSLELAQRQLAVGAVGVTCAKPAEARVFADAGVSDVRIAYPMTGSRAAALLELTQQTRLSFCVDSLEAARDVGAAFDSNGRVGRVLLKIDCGYGRAGWRWDHPDLPDVASALAGIAGLRVLGVLTHAGQSYNGSWEAGGEVLQGSAALVRHAADERDRTQQAAEVVAGTLGIEPGRFEVSIGSTPTFSSFAPSASLPAHPVTEFRPGNYIFCDLTQVDLGAASLSECGLSVLARVVTARERGGRQHALIDAGKKVFTSDQRVGQEGFGLVLASIDGSDGRVADDVHLHALSEEHGWIDAPPETFSVGQVVRVLVNHACVVVSTQRRLVEVDGGAVIGELAVDAGHCST